METQKELRKTERRNLVQTGKFGKVAANKEGKAKRKADNPRNTINEDKERQLRMFGKTFPLSHKFKLKAGAMESPKMRKRGRDAIAMRLFKSGRSIDEVAKHPELVEYITKNQGLKGDNLARVAHSSTLGSIRWLVRFGLIEGTPDVKIEAPKAKVSKSLISLRLDDRLVRAAQEVLGAKSRTQTIEMSLEAIIETEKHRKLIKRFSGKASREDFDRS